MQFLAAVSNMPVSVHEWSQTVSITTILWAVITLLAAALLWYAKGDRGEIKNTLTRLVEVVEALRIDLAENYAKKTDVMELDRKVEKLRDHIEIRRGGVLHNVIKDSEAG